MIVLTNRDSCKAANVDDRTITDIQELSEDIEGRFYPFSRVFLKDDKQGHEYTLDVVESKKKIFELIRESTK